MSDTILNKLNIKSKPNGVMFSKEELQKENKELLSELDKRINDLLHRIEFTNAEPKEAYKLYCKLQGFLKKKRALKYNGEFYVPRTETGNYIIKGKVTKKKRNFNKKR